MDEVQEFLKDNVAEKYEVEWPFLRDHLKYCHCLITKGSVVITPILPLVDLIPSFSECKRRIFMSATIPDDSDIIRAFDAEPDAALRPLSSKSLAGVSERMILVPELMSFKLNDAIATVKGIATNAAKAKWSTVILVPSGFAAKDWQDVAQYADSPKTVDIAVRQLTEGASHGPFVFANRYDGIDLPGASCRLLILSGAPRAAAEYDTYRANSFAGATSLNRAIAQKLEQGMGRAARGPGDYCVVVIVGRDLVAWLGKDANLRFLTTSTHSQLEMGLEISKSIAQSNDLVDTINKCFKRVKDWVEYHAETLADLTLNIVVDADAVNGASAERKALQLWRDGYHEKAIAKVTKAAEEPHVDNAERGWLFQLAARIAFDWGKEELALELQQRAFAKNRNLLRPWAAALTVEVLLPGPQAETIVSRVGSFRFKRGYIAEFENIVSYLVSSSTSDQFESALSELGSMLGFEASRPEKQYGNGPDVLWIISSTQGLIIEAKSRKNKANALTKEQHGQLLVSEKWFENNYPGLAGTRVSVHPNVTATKNAVATSAKALTLGSLNELIGEARKLINDLCNSGHPHNELSGYCEQLLRTSNLTPKGLLKHYLVDFQVQVE